MVLPFLAGLQSMCEMTEGYKRWKKGLHRNTKPGKPGPAIVIEHYDGDLYHASVSGQDFIIYIEEIPLLIKELQEALKSHPEKVSPLPPDTLYIV